MARHVLRRWLLAVMAVALIMPPLTGVVARALGGDGRHVHVDHVWHQDAAAHAAEHSGANAGHDGEHDEQPCNHFHIAVMALFETAAFDIAPISRHYDPVRPTLQSGRAAPPPSRPPRHMA